jgi:3D (Asp-Asp-Asp) domain-containing protein
MMLTRSLKQKIAATCGAMLGFVLLHEVTMLDSKVTAAREMEIRERTARPAPGARLRFTATAYCRGTTTASGTAVRTGIAAADPALLPVGSVVQIESLGVKYNGIYTIMDTGPQVQGRELDIYMWSCHEALAFGRRGVTLNVLRLGWNPRASSPASIQSLFRSRERHLDATRAAAENPVSPAGPPASPPPAGPDAGPR